MDKVCGQELEFRKVAIENFEVGYARQCNEVLVYVTNKTLCAFIEQTTGSSSGGMVVSMGIKVWYEEVRSPRYVITLTLDNDEDVPVEEFVKTAFISPSKFIESIKAWITYYLKTPFYGRW